MTKIEAPRVILVTDLTVVPEAELFRRIDATRTLPAEVRRRFAVQLREPEMDGGAKLRLGERLRAATRAIGAQFIVNDRLDLAIALGADGVHLGSRSVSVKDARELVGAAFVTRACHSVAEVIDAAIEGADGALLSPIFASPGKGNRLGVEAIAEARRGLSESFKHLSLFGLGGVDAATARSCVDAGADGVAVVRADIDRSLIAALANCDDPI